MDPQTLELLSSLQAGPYDEPAWKHHRGMLRTQRRVLRAQQDLSTLADLVQLLDTWAQNCGSPRVAAEVLREAADVAERDLSQAAAAADLRKRAVAIGHAESLGAGTTHTSTGMRRKDSKDLNEAIAQYERALDDDADMETVYHLAELYSQRGDPGDAQQAADLYYTLGDVLGHPAGLPMLQRALEHVPEHADARKLLAQYERAQPAAAQPTVSQRPPTRREAPVDELGPAPMIHTAPNAATLRARTQPKSARTNSINAARTNEPRGRTATPAYMSGAPPKEQAAPRSSAPAPGGGDPRKTTPGIAPAIVQANLASGGKAFGTNTSDARRGNTAHAIAAESIADEPAAATEPAGKTPPALRVATPSDSAETSKAPPPLRAAERRAAGQIPGPHPAPVITIVQSGQSGQSAAPSATSAPPTATSVTPSGTSLSPSGTTAPVTSLSPVVTDENTLERSRARLSATRSRKRKIVAGALSAFAVAAVATFFVAPRSLQDAQQLAKRMFGGEQTGTSAATNTATASRPDSDPSQQMASGALNAKETTQGAVTAGNAAPSITPTPIPGIPTAAPAAVAPAAPAMPTPAPTAVTETPAPATPPAKKEAAAPQLSVRAVIDQVNQRGSKLSDQQLTAALEKAAPKLEQCYAQALEKKPRLKGRLIVAWTVRPNGKVSGAKKQGGTIKDADLARCTIDAISATKFPKSKKQQAVLIRLPFEYRKS
jgi:hypothetical protein